MAIIGFVLIIAGAVMNFRVLRKPYPGAETAADLMRTPPWRISVVLVLAGLVLLFVFR